MAEERRGTGRSSLLSKALHLAGRSAGSRKGSDGEARDTRDADAALAARQQRDRGERDHELDLLRQMRTEAASSLGGEDTTGAGALPTRGNGSMTDPWVPGSGHGLRVPRALGAPGSDQADFMASGFIPTVVLDYQDSRAFERAYRQAGLGPTALDKEALLQGDPTPVISLTPEVETAAMRFANGDFEGAEASLVGALDGGAEAADDVNTWLTLLDFYQATNQREKFKARANALARIGKTPLGWLVIDDHAEAQVSMQSGDAGMGVGWIGLELRGELVGDVTDALIPLTDLGQIDVIQLNCRALRRVDFGAATELTQWILKQSAQGQRVVFQEVNWLIAALFDMLGVSESAWVMRRIE